MRSSSRYCESMRSRVWLNMDYQSLSSYDSSLMYLPSVSLYFLFFFFQAEDGIRDVAVTGVQTCALPIYTFGLSALAPLVLSAIVGGKGGAPGWLRYVDPIFGNMIYSLFQQGNYAPTREKAFKEAQAGIGGLGSAYQQAAQSGDPAQVLKALGTAQAGGHLRAGLNISPEMAQALGMAPGAAEFANVSPEQFGSLLGYYGKNPQAIGASITGSGDVPYMPQKQAVQIAGNIASNAQNVIRNTVMRQQVQNWLQGLQAPAPAAATPAPAGGIPPSLLALMGGGGGATQDPLLLQLMLQGAA